MQEWPIVAATGRPFPTFQSYLLKVLQMSETALKTRSEKLTFTFTYFMLGSCSRSSLCCGVNWSLASAWIPYLSRVQCVFRSHVFFLSHHNAWSDQSFFTSKKKKKTQLTPLYKFLKDNAAVFTKKINKSCSVRRLEKYKEVKPRSCRSVTLQRITYRSTPFFIAYFTD